LSLVARVDQNELSRHSIHGAALSVGPKSEELTEIGKLIDQKKIKVIVSQTLPLSEAKRAQEQVATDHIHVLKVADEPK
jgi:NADPH:quinone reductase-like Zn-dependent oxidoreductase